MVTPVVFQGPSPGRRQSTVVPLTPQLTEMTVTKNRMRSRMMGFGLILDLDSLYSWNIIIITIIISSRNIIRIIRKFYIVEHL